MVLMKEWLWCDLRKQRHDVARNLLLPDQLHIETSRQQHNERPLSLSVGVILGINLAKPDLSPFSALLLAYENEYSIRSLKDSFRMTPLCVAQMLASMGRLSCLVAKIKPMAGMLRQVSP